MLISRILRDPAVVGVVLMDEQGGGDVGQWKVIDHSLINSVDIGTRVEDKFQDGTGITRAAVRTTISSSSSSSRMILLLLDEVGKSECQHRIRSSEHRGEKQGCYDTHHRLLLLLLPL